MLYMVNPSEPPKRRKKGRRRNPELLILDESTSALDEETEDELLRCLENLKKEITIIIVSHRKNTLKNCSKIIKI